MRKLRKKIIPNFSINSKLLFLAFFFFSKNPALSCKTSDGFLTSCQNLQKTNDPIPRKCPDRITEGRTGTGPFLLDPSGYYQGSENRLNIK